MTDVQKLGYEQARATSNESTRCLLVAFGHLGIPHSLNDIGCGDGHLVVLADSLGCTAMGYDLNVKPLRISQRSQLVQADLRQSISPPPAEMVVCWEVAEHLDESASPALVDSVIRATNPGGLLLWTAATPGQGGSGHVNEQLHDYWIEQFKERDFLVQEVTTTVLRASFSQVAPRAWWYGKNLVVLRRQP